MIKRYETARTTDVSGIRMIEVVERIDKTFAIGFQFHPEAAIVKNLDNAENKADYMDYETAMKDGTEDNIQDMLPDKLPADIQKLYDNSFK